MYLTSSFIEVWETKERKAASVIFKHAHDYNELFITWCLFNQFCLPYCHCLSHNLSSRTAVAARRPGDPITPPPVSGGDTYYVTPPSSHHSPSLDSPGWVPLPQRYSPLMGVAYPGLSGIGLNMYSWSNDMEPWNILWRDREGVKLHCEG